MRNGAITVASYNIHKGLGLDRQTDLGRTAAVLGELDADVIALQEVFEPQAEELAKRLSREVHMGVAMEWPEIGPYGNALLSLLPVEGAERFDLTCPPRCPRAGMRIDVRAPGGAMLHVFNVHFGLSLRERASQARQLVREHLRAAPWEGPRILTGDFNEWLPGGAVWRVLRRVLTTTRLLRRTHPAPLPIFPLDRVFWERGMRAQVHVHRSRLARVTSDHLPLVARFSLPTAS
jgi:endonuclease/exonuclease/phosphatase family metal-dependent hydrolase